MTKIWKATVVLSILLTRVSFAAIAVVVKLQNAAQWENLGLFQKLSSDRQALRRELNQAKIRFENDVP